MLEQARVMLCRLLRYHVIVAWQRAIYKDGSGYFAYLVVDLCESELEDNQNNYKMI